MNPTLLEAAPRHEVQTKLSPADHLERAAAIFYAMNSDLFLGESVMLQQLYQNSAGELRDPREDSVAEQSTGMDTVAMFSIAMHMNEPASPKFTVIEARPGEGREVVTVGLHEGLTARYDAQGVLRKPGQLDAERHQEYLTMLANYLSGSLINKRIARLNAERLHSTRRLGEFMLNPVIEVHDGRGGTQRVRLDTRKDENAPEDEETKYEKLVREMQARIDKIGFQKWPPSRAR